MAWLDLETIAQVGAARMLNSTAAGLVLAVLSGAMLRLFRVRSPKTRFTLWFVTLLVTASLPFLPGRASTIPPDGGHEARWFVPGAWAWALAIAWATVAALLLVRLAVSFWQMERLRWQSRAIDPRFNQISEQALEQSGCKRRVRFCSSSEVGVPTTIGFFRPTVILPPWALSELSSEELKLVLLHELAHLGRGDDWTNLFEKLLKSFFFFHPAFYWIEARLALEREMACDELVLERTRNPRAYARSLVSLAERRLAGRMGTRRAWALAQSALGRMRHASLRMLAILSPTRADGDRARAPAVVAIGTLAAVTLVLMPYAPELIVFGSPQLNHQTPMAASALASANENLVTANPIETLTRPAAPKLIPARAKLRVHRKPALVRTKARAEEPARSPGIVVIESTGFDGAGAVISRICVWRVRFDDPSRESFEQIIVTHVL